MRELWTKFSVPIVVSAVGLLLVMLLGFAPLFGRSAPKPVAAAPAPQVSPVVASEPDASALAALEASVAQQSRALDSLTNRISTLEKGITRINSRLVSQGTVVDDLQSIGPEVARTSAQIAILNKAVPRINARVTSASDAARLMPDLQKQIAFLEGQMRILNKAVPRLQARIQDLQSN